MNKLTLFLNDKEIISEIAKDPEVQIKIKDAIIDGAIRRCAKTENTIAHQISEVLRKEVFDNSMWGNNLNDKYKEIVREEAKEAVESFVRSEMRMLIDEANKQLNYCKALVIAKLENSDINNVIHSEIIKAVNEKFK